MKLRTFPVELPIEAIGKVTSILGTLIASLADQTFFLDDDYKGHCETIECLREDLQTCRDMYDEWEFDPDAGRYTKEFAKMDDYMAQVEAFLIQAEKVEIH